MAVCPECGKRHVVTWPELSPFRRGDDYYCSPKCYEISVSRDMTKIKQVALIRRQRKNMKLKWEDGSTIMVKAEHGEVVISANREGLLSLTKQLAALAEEQPGTHIHYDEYNSLEEGSAELIIEKKD